MVEEVAVEMGCGGSSAAAEGVDRDLVFINDSSSIHGVVCSVPGKLDGDGGAVDNGSWG